jgi:AraC-like DNA-binding protein
MTNLSKYLTITDADRQWGFYVTTVGYNKIYPHEAYPKNNEHPGSHSFTWNRGRILDAYYLVFISKGEGVFESAVTKPVKINGGTCFFLFPGIWHRYKPNQTSGWEEYWVGFKGLYPDILIKNGFFKPQSPFIHMAANDMALQLFRQMIVTVRSSDFNYQPIISGITLQLLGLFSTIANGSSLAQNPGQILIEKAKFLMQENMETVLSIGAIANELPMGYPAFRKTFKKVTGLSPNQYYLDARLKKAIELMRSTKLNFKEIAHKTGFESPFYFSKLFKKKYGTGPKAFRGN